MVEMRGRWHALVVVKKVVVGEGQVEALSMVAGSRGVRMRGN